jgi:hypothetical protein
MQNQAHLTDFFRAGYPILLLQTYEFDRAYQLLRAICKAEDFLLYRWNCVEGMGELGLSFETVLPIGDRVQDASQVMAELARRTDSRDAEIYVLESFDDYYDQPDVKVLLRKLAFDLPRSPKPKHVVLLSPLATLPEELRHYVAVLPLQEPSEEELLALLAEEAKRFESKPDPALAIELAKAAKGMTAQEARLAFRLAGVRDGFGHRSLEAVREAAGLLPRS